MTQQNTNTTTISLSDLNLPERASSVMDYHSPVTAFVGSTLYVGYLADDNFCPNPVEDSAGLGHIYTSHRSSQTHADMQEVLGLNSDWDRNFDLVDAHSERLRPMWIAAAKQSDEFHRWADRSAGRGARLDEAYYERRAQKLWRETKGQYMYQQPCIDIFEFTTEARTELWKQLRSERLIGDPDLIILECYQHGGQHWSISGHGNQCPWDTTSGVGVWVPDESARELIDQRAQVYTFGTLKDNGFWTRKSGKKRYYAEMDQEFGGLVSPHFNQWHEAFDWLSKEAAKCKLPRSSLKQKKLKLQGRMRAACELAVETLGTYNQWLQGSTYAIVIAEYQSVGTAENPQWSLVDYEESCGFIGDDPAMDEVHSLIECKVKASSSIAA